MSGPLTDFSRYGHEELVRMVHAGRPATIRGAGDLWHDVGRQLHDRAAELDAQLSRFAPMWAGAAAEQYSMMVTDLSKGIRSVADTALTCRNVVLGAGEALASAQSRMPAPVAVDPVDPTVAALADGSLPVSTAAALWEAAGPTGRANLTRQVQLAQQQMSAAGAAHADAVAVMTQLAAEYVHARETVPVTPQAAAPPPLSRADPRNPAAQVLLDPDQPGVVTPVLSSDAIAAPSPPGGPTGGGSSTPPLFSTVYTSGLVAAGAALAGFGSRLGGLLRRPGAASAKKRTATGRPAGTAAGPTGGVGGGTGAVIGGGGASIGGGAVGSGTPAAVPTASPELAGGSPAGRVAESAVIGAARAAASPAGAGQLGAMPFMPMGGAGDAAAAGGGRRIPPWLVETEDVWGESVVVTPPVIGETTPKPGRR